MSDSTEDLEDKIDPALMAEYDRLAAETKGHKWSCTCDPCKRFMELGKQIQTLSGGKIVA